KLRDLHRSRVDVDTIEVLAQDFCDERGFIDCTGRAAARPLNIASRCNALREQPPKRRDEERTGAAGGIDDTHRLETLDVSKRSIWCRRALIRSGVAAGLLRVGEPRAERLLDQVVHHRLRRVIDAVALAFGKLGDRLASFELSFTVLQLGDRLLQNMAERIKAEAFLHVASCRVIVAAGKIEERTRITLQGSFVRALSSLREDVVRNVQFVDKRVSLEQSSVDLRQRQAVERAATIHQTEQALKKIPQLRAVLVIERLDAAAAQKIPKHFRRKQHPLAHVFAEESENKSVEKLLGQSQQLAGPTRKIGVI